MTITSDQVNQYLLKKKLTVHYFRYRYSQGELFSEDTAANLVAPEQQRLLEKHGRFDVFDDYGGLYLDGVTSSYLEEALPGLLATKRLIPLTADVTDLPVVIDLIHQVNARGFKVVGSNQACYQSWEVVDDQLLVQALTAGTDYVQLAQMTSEAGPIMVNLQNEVVMRQLESKKTIETWPTASYEIYNHNDELVLHGISLEKLAAVLYCLLLEIRPEDIVALLLTPRGIGAYRLARTKLVFEEHHTSQSREVHSITDIKLLENLAIEDDDDHYAAKFRLYDEKFKVAMSDEMTYDALPLTLYFLSHEQLPKLQDAGQSLSDSLLNLASQAGLVVERKSRLLEDISFAEKFELADGKIQSFKLVHEAWRYDDPSTNQIETVYQLVDHSTEQVRFYDLSIDELVTTLLTRVKAIKQSVDTTND